MVVGSAQDGNVSIPTAVMYGESGNVAWQDAGLYSLPADPYHNTAYDVVVDDDGFTLAGRSSSVGIGSLFLRRYNEDLFGEEDEGNDQDGPTDGGNNQNTPTDGGETKDKVKAGKTGVGQSGKSVAQNSELLAYILATTAVTAFAVMLVVRRFNAEER